PSPPPRRSSQRSARIIERRSVAAHAAVGERQRPVLRAKLLGDELLSRPLVPWDHARDCLRTRIAVADAHRHPIADPKQLTPARVVGLDIHVSYCDQLALLPCPGKVLQGISAE